MGRVGCTRTPVWEGLLEHYGLLRLPPRSAGSEATASTSSPASTSCEASRSHHPGSVTGSLRACDERERHVQQTQKLTPFFIEREAGMSPEEAGAGGPGEGWCLRGWAGVGAASQPGALGPPLGRTLRFQQGEVPRAPRPLPTSGVSTRPPSANT